MKLFGRNVSLRPAATDVPPELRPYYSSPAPTSSNTRRLAALLAVLTVSVATLGGDLWLRHQVATTPAATMSKPTARQHPSSSQQRSPGSVTQPSNPGSNANPPSGSPTVPSSTSNPIPNTGPGDGSIVAAVAVGLVAATLYHVYQRRTIRS